jgi:hypothetical protein
MQPFCQLVKLMNRKIRAMNLFAPTPAAIVGTSAADGSVYISG